MFRGRDFALVSLFVLAYCGAITYVWPLISHFHHKDVITSFWIEYAVRAVFIPFALGFMFGVASDRPRAWKWSAAAGSVLLSQSLMWILEYWQFASLDWSGPVAIIISWVASAGGAYACPPSGTEQRTMRETSGTA